MVNTRNNLFSNHVLELNAVCEFIFSRFSHIYFKQLGQGMKIIISIFHFSLLTRFHTTIDNWIERRPTYFMWNVPSYD